MRTGTLQHFGGAAVGAVTGYLVAGFLICMVETLPLDQNFLDFEPRTAGESSLRSVFPPDRVWLALMNQASKAGFRWKEDRDDPEGGPAFDRDGTFELRYARYRRTTETRPAMPYFGEFDRELGRDKREVIPMQNFAPAVPTLCAIYHPHLLRSALHFFP